MRKTKYVYLVTDDLGTTLCFSSFRKAWRYVQTKIEEPGYIEDGNEPEWGIYTAKDGTPLKLNRHTLT